MVIRDSLAFGYIRETVKKKGAEAPFFKSFAVQLLLHHLDCLATAIRNQLQLINASCHTAQVNG